MQPKISAPRAAYTAAEVEETLAHTAGNVLRWGVDVLDADGVSKTAIVYSYNTSPEWTSGTLYGTTIVGDTLSR